MRATPSLKAILYASAVSLCCGAGAAYGEVRSFNIPSGNALTTIPEYGRQSGLQIMAPGDELGGIRTSPVAGSLDTRAALQQLIKGTGLTVALDDGTAITLRKAKVTATGDLAASTESGDEIIVTAQKRAEPLQNVPLSITALAGEKLAAMGVADTLDLKSVVPGLNLTLNGAYVQPTIRGISTTIAEPGSDANIAIYLDGIYQPAQAANAFDLPDVSRIEVLKGPQGTLFGRNATGGAIQVFTRDPTFTTSGSFSVSTGVYEVGGFQEKVKGYLAGPLTSKLAGSMSAYFTNDDGYMRNVFDGERLGYQNGGVRGKLLYQASDSAKFVLSAYYLQRDDHHSQATRPLNNNTLGLALDPTIVIPDGNYNVNVDFIPRLRTRSFGVTLRSEFELAAGTLTSLTGYQNNVVNRNQTDADSSPVFIAHYINPYQDRAISQEITFASQKFGPLSIIGGVYFFHDRASFEPFIVDGLLSLDAKVKTTAAAGFSELTYDITPRLTVIAGLRYSWERKEAFADVRPLPYGELGAKSWTGLTPRASIRYAVGEKSNLYFTYSKGFKSGVFSPATLSPIPVNPEKIQSYEVGFKTAQHNYSLSGAAFYYDYQDIQVSVLNGLVEVTDNAAKAEIYGVELNGTWRPVDPFELQLGISYLPVAKYVTWPDAAVQVPTGLGGNMAVTRDVSGSRLIRAPRFTAMIGGTYTSEFDTGALGLSMNAYYTTSYPLVVSNGVKQNAYTLVNAEVSWTFSSSGWRAAAFVRNLIDERDIVGTTDIGSFADGVAYEAPRQFGVSVDYSF